MKYCQICGYLTNRIETNCPVCKEPYKVTTIAETKMLLKNKIQVIQ